MRVAEFMQKLNDLLQDVSEAERSEALQYYKDYFEDAELTQDQEVPVTIGSPDEVAEGIRNSMNGKQDMGEFTEQGYQRPGASKDEVICAEQMVDTDPKKTKAKKKDKTAEIVLIVILAILLSPVWISLLGTLFGILTSLFGILLAIAIVVPVIGLAFLIVSVSFLVIGLMTIWSSPLNGGLMIGLAMLFFGIVLLFLMATVWLYAIVFPWFIRGVVYLCKMPFRKKEVVA